MRGACRAFSAMTTPPVATSTTTTTAPAQTTPDPVDAEGAGCAKVVEESSADAGATATFLKGAGFAPLRRLRNAMSWSLRHRTVALRRSPT
jgi:hypothetical protein